MLGLLAFILCLLTSALLFGQKKVIINDQNILIPFVEIRNQNGKVLGYADYHGSFDLSSFSADTYSFISNGYESIDISSDEMKKIDTLVMNSLAIVLEEVKISANPIKNSELWYNIKPSKNLMTIKTNSTGTTILSEVGTSKKQSGKLDGVEFRIKSVSEANVYIIPKLMEGNHLDEKDEHGANLLSSVKMIELHDQEDEYFYLDLSHANVYLESDKNYLLGFTMFSTEGTAEIQTEANFGSKLKSRMQGSPKFPWQNLEASVRFGLMFSE